MVIKTIQFKVNMKKEKITFEDDYLEDDDISDSSLDEKKEKSRPLTQPLFLNFTSDLSPQKMNKKKSKTKKQTAYRVNGVNILNRNNLDSKTAIERIQRRRENHNHVERRRRDNINNIILELSNVVPNATQPGQKPNKGNILKLSLDYIKELQAENNSLKDQLKNNLNSNNCTPSSTCSSPSTPILNNSNLSISHHNMSAPNSPHCLFHTPSLSQTISLPSSPILSFNLNSPINSLPIHPPLSSNDLPISRPSHFFIPQPPIYTSSDPLYHTSSNLRPILPATTSIELPPARMSGYEKIYGNVCRY